MPYYKIVQVSRGILRYSYAFDIEDMPCVMYKPDYWTIASEESLHEGYGLFVFDSYEAAVQCMQLGMELWEADVEGAHKGPLPPFLDVVALAEGYRVVNRNSDTWPQGTIMVRAVKLVKFLSDDM
jgi:hypothetical protein